MLLSYLKIGIRNILKYKSFSVINITGLAFGIAASLVVFLYISYERSFDTFNENADNIYRLKNVRYYTSGTDSSAGCTALLGPALKDEIPEVINFTRIRKISALVTADYQSFNERNIFWADSTFFSIFSFPFISGMAENSLAVRNTAVLTRSTSDKYFKKENVLGKIIHTYGMDFEITGVTEDVPANSHLKFDILLSFITQLNDRYCWTCNNNNTYIQLAPGKKKSVIEEKLPLVVSKIHNRQEDGFDRAYFLQPLKDIHLYSNLRFEHEKNGNARTVYILSLIAIIIILMAWINYVNLSTARSLERAKEVGIRKVAGAGFRILVQQFLSETFIINFFAVLLALFIVDITSPFWDELIRIPSSFWKTTSLPLLVIVLVFITPLAAGIYPAFVLSSYTPGSILHGSFKTSSRGVFLRKVLVVFQFSVSVVLLTVIIVFNRQLAFMINKDLGFDIKQKLVVNAPSPMQAGADRISLYKTFTEELQNQVLITNGTFSSVIPGIENGDVTGGVRQSEQAYDEGKQVYFNYVADNFFEFFGIDLISGRNFLESELKGLYTNGFNAEGLIINESAVKKFGFSAPEKAIGASIYIDNGQIGNVIGVVNDYHQQSLEKEIKPSIFEGVTSGNYFIFDISTDKLSQKIDGIRKNFTDFFPGNPFESYFLDEFFNSQYNTDIQTIKIISLFTFLSILISCLGLIGLSSIITIQRTKEIGIRKVYGSSVESILTLLSGEFITWILISTIIAWPAAFYLMNKWLNNFAYRIELEWWMFILAGFIAIGIALLTVTCQSWRAATRNPVESLRYE